MAQKRCAAAVFMSVQAGCEIVCEAEIMAGVFESALEMDQVDTAHLFQPWRSA